MKKYLLFISVFFCGFAVHGRQIEKQTYLYSVKDADSLYLDRYYSPENPVNSPCVIFMFGGGFFTGQRDGKGYIPYFEYMVDNGFTVVSIDYRLGFKRFAENPEQQAEVRSLGKIKMAKAFISIFRDAVDIAVEDLFDATSYVLDHAAEWGVDPEQIVANGSSAGAVSVLQGEYAICNGWDVVAKLPAGFNYAGIVSFAGAVLVDSRNISFATPPCPIMLFHGDADSNVPYNRMRKLGMGFFGSKHISKTLAKMDSPHIFYSVENADHAIAGTPMTDNRHDILSFLEKLVDKDEQLMIFSDVEQPGVSKKKKRFGLADYIKANFGTAP